MLSNACLLAKIGADTAENEQHFADILPKIGNYPTGRLTAIAALRRSAAPSESPASSSGRLSSPSTSAGRRPLREN